jgi:hypothetical protein
MANKNESGAALAAVEVEPRRPLAVDTEKTVTKRRRTSSGATETSLQLLARLFGLPVVEVIPLDVREAVEASYEFWKAHPDSYLVTEFDAEQDKLDALGVMKAYAEIAPGGPYTIRVDWDSLPSVLHWRAQTRQGRREPGETTPGE